jgi:hypothetical protein
MARVQGQHKSMAEKAQEQYEAQQTLVDKLVDKRSELMAKVKEINDALDSELVMLEYYKAHPLLDLPTPEDEYVPDWSDQELPLEIQTQHSKDMQDDIGDALARQGKEITFKGLKGRAVLP